LGLQVGKTDSEEDDYRRREKLLRVVPGIVDINIFGKQPESKEGWDYFGSSFPWAWGIIMVGSSCPHLV